MGESEGQALFQTRPVAVALVGLAILACLVGAGSASARVVVLGDSFASGDGAPPFGSTDRKDINTCHRSERAWSLLVADRLESKMRSFACSGARVDDVVASAANRKEPERRTAQVQRLARVGDASLVLVMVGGNDIGFGEVLRYCVWHARCQHRYSTGDDSLAARIQALRGRLPDAYRSVRLAAPHARIAVIGYPRILADPEEGCLTDVGIVLGAQERRFLNVETDRLNGAIAFAASQAGIDFIDTATTFRNHEAGCDRAWVNATAASCGTCVFHPNLRGQRALAVRVAPAVGARPFRLLHIYGIGPAKFGMTREEIEVAWGEPLDCFGSTETSCTCFRPRSEPDLFLSFDPAAARGGRFTDYWAPGRTLTDQMILKGDRATLLRSAYPKLRRLSRKEGITVLVVRDRQGKKHASMQFSLGVHNTVFQIFAADHANAPSFQFGFDC